MYLVSMCISRWPFKRSFVRVYLAAIDVSLFIALHTLTTWPTLLLSRFTILYIYHFLSSLLLPLMFYFRLFLFYSSAVITLHKRVCTNYDLSCTISHIFELTICHYFVIYLLLTFCYISLVPGMLYNENKCGCSKSEFCIFNLHYFSFYLWFANSM